MHPQESLQSESQARRGCLRRRGPGTGSRAGQEHRREPEPARRRRAGGASPVKCRERATAVRAYKCLSDLAIRRSSVAMRAAGGQEAAGEKGLPRRR